MNRLILYCTLCLLHCTAGSAQQLPASHYTIREGLAQMQCMAVLKDSRGYVWAGTKDGLSKFDGERFETFTTRDGLVTNYIVGLAEDPNGYIWTNNSRGLTRFDGKTFTPFRPADPALRLAGLWIGADGWPVVVADNGKIKALMHLKNGVFVALPNTTVDPQQGGEVSVVFVDQTRRQLGLSIGKTAGQRQLAYFRNGQLSPLADLGQQGAEYTHRDPMADGTPLIKSSNPKNPAEETYSFLQNGRLTPFFRTDGHAATVLRPVHSDCVLTHGSRHYLLEKNSIHLVALPLPPTQLWQYVFDRGGLWCATEKGLYRVWNNGFRYFSEAGVPYCWSVVEDRRQNLWFLNYRSPLLRYNGHTISRVPGYEKAIVNTQSGVADEWYYHPIRDQYGHLWLTNYMGAIRYDGQQFLKITDPARKETLCLLEDPARKLILKGGMNQVLFIENKPPFRFTRFDRQTGFNDPNELVLSMAKDPDGSYWFGGKYLTRYDYERKKVRYYTPENGKFPGLGVWSLSLDSRQNLWAASKKGLFLYDRPSDRFQCILADSVVSSVMLVGQFDRDHLLIGDLKNLYVLDLPHFYKTRQARCTVFNPFNGFMGTEPGQDGYYKDSRGYIWITSGSVLSRLDPKRIDLSPGRLQTRVAKVNGDRIAFVGKPATVDLADGENMASFTVETLGDDRSFFTEYSYRVPGFLDKWSAWQTQNLITLTNLPGGTYTLDIRSRTGSINHDAPAQTSLVFRVLVPFWKAPDFYKKALFIFLMLSLLIGVLGTDWYLKQRRIRRQQQAIQDRERQVQFLQVQTIQAQMNPHFLFNVLGTIQHLIVANDTEQAAANLLKLSHLMRNYLEASMLSDETQGSLFAHEVPLAREIELLTMYIEFEKLQYGDRFTHEVVVAGKLNPESYHLPPLILQPYVENAIKHGLLYAEKPGHLGIRFATIDDEVLICTIEDNGIGRQQARERQQTSLKKYRSRGTELTGRRVELLNQMGYAISIDTTDGPTGGTSVTIQIGYKLEPTPEKT